MTPASTVGTPPVASTFRRSALLIVIGLLVLGGLGGIAVAAFQSDDQRESDSLRAGVPATPEEARATGEIFGGAGTWTAVSFTDKRGDLCLNIQLRSDVVPSRPGTVGGCFEPGASGQYGVSTVGDSCTTAFAPFVSGYIPNSTGAEEISATFENGDVVAAATLGDGLYLAAGNIGARPVLITIRNGTERPTTIGIIQPPSHCDQ